MTNSTLVDKISTASGYLRRPEWITFLSVPADSIKTVSRLVMMNLPALKKMISQGENETTEFKRKIVHPEKVIREAVAFANTKGGWLLVGVDDNGTIPGCKYAEEEDFVMKKAFEELCRPKLKYDSYFIKITEKRAVIAYYIHESERKPHYAHEKKHQRYGKAFVRVKDRSIQASFEIRKILKFSNQPQDVHFQYGENEQRLFHFLNDHAHITLNKFREITGLDKRGCSEILITMVLANALKIIPQENEDLYLAVP